MTNTTPSENPQSEPQVIELIAVNQTVASPLHKSIEEFETDVALWEDPQALNQLAIEVHSQYPSSSIVQRHIVDSIVQTIWRQRRIPAIEGAMMAKGRADQLKPYTFNSPNEIVEQVCQLENLRTRLLIEANTEKVMDECWSLGVQLMEKLLPAHPTLEKQFPGALRYGPKEQDNEQIDKGGKLYETYFKKLGKIAKELPAKWESAIGQKAKIEFLSCDTDDGFLLPYWNADFKEPEGDEWEQYTYTTTWTFENKAALELAVWLIKVASKNYASWIRSDANIGGKELARVQKGLYFIDAPSIEKLNKYEAHLHKHLLELINAYYVLASKSA